VIKDGFSVAKNYAGRWNVQRDAGLLTNILARIPTCRTIIFFAQQKKFFDRSWDRADGVKAEPELDLFCASLADAASIIPNYRLGVEES